ncbi:response regulator [Pseudomonas protegens]|uniref:response regulator n=1 Tax=Pseudomonas protegens TaxID=380021 RepID=UPI0037F6FD8A
MPTPSLRILIVENEHLQRLSIERMLNQYGYHRVAPVSSFDELLVMTDHAVEPFDLLVINSALTVGINLEDFCHRCPYIRNALIYEGTPVPVPVAEEESGYRVVKKLSGIPDSETVKSLMSEIDPGQKKNIRRRLFRRLLR